MKKLILVLFLLCTTQSIFSQNKTTAPSVTEVTQTPVEDAQLKEVIKNLKAARNNEDIAAKLYWEKKLNELTHTQIAAPVEAGFIVKKGADENSAQPKARNISKITDKDMVANSVSRERITGVIYAAIGVFGNNQSSDTLKVYRSTNNGINFNLLYALTAPNLKITHNGLDIEAISRGDSTYAFVAMNYTANGNTSCLIVRVREDGQMITVNTGAFGVGNVKYINGRITSDNARYTNATYIYLTATMDSVVSGQRNLVQKIFRVTNPFAFNMTVTKGFQGAAAQYGYFVGGAAPDSAKFETDVAYVNTAGDIDHLYTVTCVRGVIGSFNNGTSLYYTRSTDYGASAPGLFNVADGTFLKERPRIAGTGNADNSLLTVTRRHFAGSDWDAYSFYSANITVSSPTFTPQYINSGGDTTNAVAVTGKYRSPGVYIVGHLSTFSNSGEGDIFVNNFIGGVVGSSVQVDPVFLNASSTLGFPDVTFRNVNNDSCLTIWGGIAGMGSYVTGGCSGILTSVDPNYLTVEDYQLMQNYPNPFNPSTRISYSIPSQNNVMITLYNVLGKQVALLVNEVKSAGAYSIDFNASEFSSGVYYYKIEAGSFIDTKKMLLVK